MTEEEREFIGFFMGEGCISITKRYLKSSKGIRICYEPTLTISARVDDSKIIEWCKKQFGGSIYCYKAREIIGYKGKKYKQNPVIRWDISKLSDCKKVISILNKGILPTKKKKEILVMQQFLEEKTQGKRNGFQGRWFTDEQLKKQANLKKSLSSLKVFS